MPPPPIEMTLFPAGCLNNCSLITMHGSLGGHVDPTTFCNAVRVAFNHVCLDLSLRCFQPSTLQRTMTSLMLFTAYSSLPRSYSEAKKIVRMSAIDFAPCNVTT